MHGPGAGLDWQEPVVSAFITPSTLPSDLRREGDQYHAVRLLHPAGGAEGETRGTRAHLTGIVTMLVSFISHVLRLGFDITFQQNHLPFNANLHSYI